MGICLVRNFLAGGLPPRLSCVRSRLLLKLPLPPPPPPLLRKRPLPGLPQQIHSGVFQLEPRLKTQPSIFSAWFFPFREVGSLILC
jgi:hypothetical protein